MASISAPDTLSKQVRYRRAARDVPVPRRRRPGKVPAENAASRAAPARGLPAATARTNAANERPQGRKPSTKPRSMLTWLFLSAADLMTAPEPGNFDGEATAIHPGE